MFLFYMIFTFFFNIYVHFFWRDSTYRVEKVIENGEIIMKKIKLTDKERKDLYAP